MLRCVNVAVMIELSKNNFLMEVWPVIADTILFVDLSYTSFICGDACLLLDIDIMQIKLFTFDSIQQAFYSLFSHHHKPSYHK